MRQGPKLELRDRAEIQTYSVILNGEPRPETLKEYADMGWVHLQTLPANRFHPYATEHDTIAFFAAPIDNAAYEARRLQRLAKDNDLPQTANPNH